MLRSREELDRTRELLEGARNTIAVQRAHYQAQGYTEEQLERATSVMRIWEHQFAFEVEEYERNVRGEFGPAAFSSLGRQLIALRLARGLSQKELARLLGVSEAQVSRDETNQYRNISPEKTQRVLDALGGQVEIHVSLAPQMPAEALVPAVPKRRGRPRVVRSGKTPRPADTAREPVTA